MNLVCKALENTETIDKLLDELSDIATEIDSFEYGLPLFDEGVKAQMREVVYKWLLKIQEVCK